MPLIFSYLVAEYIKKGAVTFVTAPFSISEYYEHKRAPEGCYRAFWSALFIYI